MKLTTRETAIFAMLLPKHMPKKIQPIIYMVVCGAHGLLYGILYAPSQALLYGLGFDSMIAWIAAGFPWDVIHGASNFFCGILIVPIISILKYVEERMGRNESRS